MSDPIRAQETLSAAALIDQIGRAARHAMAAMMVADRDQKDKALKIAAETLRQRLPMIEKANALDVTAARQNGLSAALIDRLSLNEPRLVAIAQAIEDIASLPDPVGHTDSEWSRPNGLVIRRVRVPLGVIGVIYESRPNVTADAGALCLKAGNCVILRGGSESFHSATAIADCLREGLVGAGLPIDAIQLVPTRDRDAVGAMLTRPDLIDVIVPRGGKSLIERVMTESRVPVFAHLDGICHVYIDGAANLAMAEKIILNAKMRRTSVCGAAETMLVDEKIAHRALPQLIPALLKAGCAIRGDAETQTIDPRVTAATEQDWHTEYLDAILSVKVVKGVAGAVEHINHYGSHHTDSIVTDDTHNAQYFLQRVDSAIVLHNASTQFADGGEFGMGAEIGIATGRMHARGPVGVEQLTTYKYQVFGHGQTRP
jgi:glutamate-5-semialdehyde dehydrogenase